MSDTALVYDLERDGTNSCRIAGCSELMEGQERTYCPTHSAAARAAGGKARLSGRPPRTEDRYLDREGYARIRIAGAFYPEHRVVMMAMLGRPLFPGESVHHRNGQRADNRPANLELWVGPIRSGARASDLVCWHCGRRWIAKIPRSLQLPVKAIGHRIASEQWPVTPAQAPSGFFQRFKQSWDAAAGPSDQNGESRLNQGVLWDEGA